MYWKRRRSSAKLGSQLGAPVPIDVRTCGHFEGVYGYYMPRSEPAPVPNRSSDRFCFEHFHIKNSLCW